MSNFPHDEHYDPAHALTRTHDDYSAIIQANFWKLGATGVRVTVWSHRDTPAVLHVILDSDAFREVNLSLEQTNLLLTHLREGTNTETAFVMAQAIEMGLDTGLIYDPATGRMKTPHAARKEEVLA